MRHVAAMFVLSMAAGLAQAADIEVEVRGVRIGAGIFARESDFPPPPEERVEAAANAEKLQLRFADLRSGEYALAVYPDRNSDNRLDMTFTRVPLKP